MEAKSFDLPRYLAVLPLFQEMTPPELQRLAEGCRLRRLARGDNVFRLGEPCEEFHVAVMGQVKLFEIGRASCRERVS
jgi:CRP-like cAMP-binding protein